MKNILLREEPAQGTLAKTSLGQLIVVTALCGSTLVFASSAGAAEKFRRLTGVQIKSAFAGKEMSDGVHWRDFYERGGTLSSVSMGRTKGGRWWIEKNDLCVDHGKEDGGCYQVWIAGKKVEFRREGLDSSILDGTL